MFMMIKGRPRLVRDSAMCRQSEVLPKLVDQVRVYQVGYMYFPINGMLTFGIK